MYLRNSYRIDLLTIFIIITAIIIAVLLPILMWHTQESTDLDVLIVDKTVPEANYREHRGLAWILNHYRYQKSNGNIYDYALDYKGFVPSVSGDFEIRYVTDDYDKRYDLIYLADTYGVYEADFGQENIFGLRSDIIYGGVQAWELEYFKQQMWQGTPIIAEFNVFASPTLAKEHSDLTNMLGIKWSGWMGRFFRELSDTEVPLWLKEAYTIQYKEPWTYEGQGLVFVDENDTVVVLEYDIDVNTNGTTVNFTEQAIERFNVQNDVYYNYWFDVVTPRASTDVLAEYQIDLTAQGVQKLKEFGIEPTFPAVLEYDNGLYKAYYFAGDYADVEGIPNIYRLRWIDRVMALVTRNTATSDISFFWKVYRPMMQQLLTEIAADREMPAPLQQPYVEDSIELVARTGEQFIEVFRDWRWQALPIKGVNMGMALPGFWFTEFIDTEEHYYRWLEMIADMNANTIRVYTLQHPAFYRALYKFNVANPDRIIYLMQEIWPEEHPPNDDLLAYAYVQEFKREIEMVIDAVHGNAVITERQGRAYGTYHADVSSYTIAYLVGREIEPFEVQSTDQLNQGYEFAGKYLVANRSTNATPTEAWLAMSCDYVLAYETEHYKQQTPVSIVSWPTLDPMEHDYALNDDGTIYRDFNDRATVDINNIKRTDSLLAGFFGSYHIYPNYPDFMNEKAEYASYRDQQGGFRYGGYLQEFMAQHTDYLALIAEFGIATGMGNAHENPDGYHHGGLSETAQGEAVVRMMEVMLREGYMGGLVFEWMDEWAKKTWTTEPYMIPYEHNVFWHNAIDPEQNYGILAMESIRPEQAGMIITEQINSIYSNNGLNLIENNNFIDRVEIRHNETFLSLDIVNNGDFDLQKHDLLIGIDTYSRVRGEYLLDEHLDIRTPTGVEFKLKLENEQNAQLLVTPTYNKSRMQHYSTYTNVGVFEEISPLINREYTNLAGEIVEAIYEDGSALRYGDITGSTHHWIVEGNTVKLQLPWARLNFTDPTERRVLHDMRTLFAIPERDGLETTISEGVLVYVNIIERTTGEVVGQMYQDPEHVYTWENWGAPTHRERLKDSYLIIRDYFANLK